eukprot:310895-Pyramimonas_sp.AAC.1
MLAVGSGRNPPPGGAPPRRGGPVALPHRHPPRRHPPRHRRPRPPLPPALCARAAVRRPPSNPPRT